MKFDDFLGFIKVMSNMQADPSVFNQAIIELDNSNFERIIHNKKKNVFVLFYAKWCNSCKELIKTFEKVENSVIIFLQIIFIMIWKFYILTLTN